MTTAIRNKSQSLFLLGVIALALGACETEAKDQEIVYPNSQAPLFSIKVPGNWTLTPGQENDQFFLVSGPAGVKMWFRAKPMSSEAEFKGAIKAAKESGKEWFSESYTGILLEEAVIGERDGMPFVSVKGEGVSKETGKVVAFTVAFASMPNGALAQLWSIIPAEDPKGFKYAKKVVDSFKAL